MNARIPSPELLRQRISIPRNRVAIAGKSRLAKCAPGLKLPASQYKEGWCHVPQDSGRLALGSDAERVLRRSPVPVLMVRSPAEI